MAARVGVREGQGANHFFIKIPAACFTISDPHTEAWRSSLRSLGKNVKMTAEKDFLSPACPNSNLRVKILVF